MYNRVYVYTLKMNGFFYFVYAVYVLNLAVSEINNVCPTIEDYYTVTTNRKCWYDFTADSNVTEIISKHGYPVEVYKTVTPDRYILTVIRIPPKIKSQHRGPVFLQHGLYSSASNFVARGKDSLAFILSDSGYDVWLGNYRGTEYSEEHVDLTTNDRKYWDYCLDEIGQLDIPAQLKVVADKTGNKQKIVYIGHSLGTTAGLIYGSVFPEQAKNAIKIFIFLAPAATLSNAITPLRLLAPLANTIFNIVNDNDLIKIASQARILRFITKTICLESPLLMKRCKQALDLIYGVNSQMGAEMIPIQLNQFPGGTSLKVSQHIAALISNFFGRYNYGIDNFKKYGSALPLQYDVSKIQLPVYIMYAAEDWTCSKKDSRILYSRLSPQAKIYGIHEVTEKNFNHVDFLFGKRVKPLVNDKIIKLLDKID